ncbi:TetR/AcrR family transcriptional regulator [Castellaniella sp.]|uniref:TetR/AcrR family transcriptional regulator n=1 Tax=Castellaniella sp. TaxID=1955812 RepID=UPI00355FF978
MEALLDNPPAVAETTRKRILDAAARLFREKGFKTTTVREIADVVGLYSGSLFHYFKSKEDILMEILRTAFISVCIRHENILQSECAPLEKLRYFIRQEIELVFFAEEGDYHAVLYFDWRSVSQTHLAELIALRKRYFCAWQTVIQQCHDSGSLIGDPTISVRVVEGTLRTMMSWYKPDGRYDPDEMSRQIIRIIGVSQ